MSRDNGIYILETTDPSYRVIHAQAIENIYDGYNGYTDDGEEFNYKELYEYFHGVLKRDSIEDAYKAADHLYRNTEFVEYGIRVIECKDTWKEICFKAKDRILSNINFLDAEFAYRPKEASKLYHKDSMKDLVNLRECVTKELLEYCEASIYEIRSIIKAWKNEACGKNSSRKTTTYIDINGRNLNIYTTIPGLLIGRKDNLINKYKQILKGHRIDEVKLEKLHVNNFVW